MTREEFDKEIREEYPHLDLADRIIKNTPDYALKIIQILRPNSKKFKSSLDFDFSPEGIEFWRDIHRYYTVEKQSLEIGLKVIYRKHGIPFRKTLFDRLLIFLKII